MTCSFLLSDSIQWQWKQVFFIAQCFWVICPWEQITMFSSIPSQTSRYRMWVWGSHEWLPNSKVTLNGFPRRTTRCFLLSPRVSWETWFSSASKLTNFSWQGPFSEPGKYKQYESHADLSKDCGGDAVFFQEAEQEKKLKRKGKVWEIILF